MRRIIGCLLMLAAPPAFARSSPDESDRPAPANALPLIEAAARGSLKDPDSARFSWPNGFVWGSYKPWGRQRAWGWVTCGTVNARNGFGGYTGPAPIIAVWRFGAAYLVDIDRPGYANVDRACRKLGVPVY